MSFFDHFRQTPGTPPGGKPKAGEPVEHIFAVPLAAHKLSATGAVSKETYVYYAFLFADSADEAVARLRKEVQDEGYEFIGLTGKVMVTSLAAWPDFVAEKFDWIKDAMPTAQVMGASHHGIVYYTPKIQML